jgi:hypothetical protein
MTPAKYLQSAFVALVTISETFPNHGAALHYKSNIVIHELFKGKSVRSILVEGSSDGKRRTCDIFFKKGTMCPPSYTALKVTNRNSKSFIENNYSSNQ